MTLTPTKHFKINGIHTASAFLYCMKRIQHLLDSFNMRLLNIKYEFRYCSFKDIKTQLLTSGEGHSMQMGEHSYYIDNQKQCALREAMGVCGEAGRSMGMSKGASQRKSFLT